MNDQWKEDVLKLADNLVSFADGLREAVAEGDQDTCLAFMIAFLERLVERRSSASGHEEVVAEVKETEHDNGRINARCICPLCNQGHDPRLIGGSGEGKDAQ